MHLKRSILTGCALGLGSFCLYVRALTFGFVSYDDGTVLLAHPALYDEHSLPRSLGEIFIRYFPREEPLIVRDITWAIDSRLFGFTNPFGYHLGNVLLNACNAVLLFLFLKHATRRSGFAALVAALWACLPLHVEPVCWVMGRKDLLSTFFVLLALLAQSIALRTDDPRRERLANLLVLLLYPLAVLSKFSAVALVGVLGAQRVFAEYLDGRVPAGAPLRWGVAAKRLMGLWPHALVGVGLYLWYNQILGEFRVTAGRGAGPLTAQHLLLLAQLTPLVFGSYLKNLVSASQHSIFYDWPSAGIALTGREQLFSAALATLLIGLCAWAARRRKDLFFYALIGPLFMVTYLNIVYVGIWVADRYAYFTSFCVLAIAVRLAGDLIERIRDEGRRRVWRGISLAAAGAFACYGVGATLRHQPAFRDAHSLWTYEAGREHPSMLALQALARSYVAQAEESSSPAERARLVKEAIQAIDRAEAHYHSVKWKPIDKYFVEAHASYAGLWVLRGRAAALAGEPEEQQLVYYRKGFAFPGNWLAAMLIERILFRRADLTGDEATAKEGLRYFTEVIRQLRFDPIRRPGLTSRLELGYRRRFPALSPQIDRIEKRYLK